jgi:hypothetical protein
MLDLRFVERTGTKQSIQPIDKFPATIGRSRAEKQPPPYHIFTTIEYAAISGVHCSIEFDIKSNTWDVIDGIDGTPSRNGIFFKSRSDNNIEKVDRITLQREGDRVYLLNLQTGEEAYVEVFNPSATSTSRGTQDVDPALVRIEEVDRKIEEKLEESYQRGRVRDARLDNIESAIESAGGILIKLDTNRVAAIRGGRVFLILTILLSPSLFLGSLLFNPDKTIEVLKEIKSLIHHSPTEKRN